MYLVHLRISGSAYDNYHTNQPQSKHQVHYRAHVQTAPIRVHHVNTESRLESKPETKSRQRIFKIGNEVSEKTTLRLGGRSTRNGVKARLTQRTVMKRMELTYC